MRRRWILLALMLALPLAAAAQSAWPWRIAVFSSLGLTLASNSLHADAAGLEVAAGEGILAERIYLRWDLQERDWREHLGGLRLRLFGQVALENWNGNDYRLSGGSDADLNTVLALAPVFRLDWPDAPRYVPYLETSTGASVFARSSFPATGHEWGQNFQFEDTLAIGWIWGENGQWELALRRRHYSNNGIKKQNDGVDFHSLALSWRY